VGLEGRAAGAPLAALSCHGNKGTVCERRDSQPDDPNTQTRAAHENGRDKRVLDDGDATLRHLVSLAVVADAQNRVPEVSLLRRRGLLVGARSSPCGRCEGQGSSRDKLNCCTRVARMKLRLIDSLL
jgi:hypothetical protein